MARGGDPKRDPAYRYWDAMLGCHVFSGWSWTLGKELLPTHIDRVACDPHTCIYCVGPNPGLQANTAYGTTVESKVVLPDDVGGFCIARFHLLEFE